MDDLIERLKAATEGSAELSEAVAKAVGWRMESGEVHDEWESPEGYRYRNLPDLTEDLGEAIVWLVPEGLEWDVSLLRVPHAPPGEAIIHTKPFWTSSQYDQDSRIVASAATPALALCIAALMAKGVRS